MDTALLAFDEFENKWGAKYNYAVKSWKNNFSELTTFFKYPYELRKLIYTTNVMENLNRNIHKITKTKGGFTNQKSLEKLIYLSIQKQMTKWGFSIVNWGLIYEQIKIIFGETYELN